MHSKNILIIFLVLSLIVFSNGSVPVLIWGTVENKYDAVPLISHFNGDQFKDFLGADSSPCVIFLAQELSNEDLSKTNNFPHLRNTLSMTYLPSVDEPLAFIESQEENKVQYHPMLPYNVDSVADMISSNIRNNSIGDIYVLSFPIEMRHKQQDEMIHHMQQQLPSVPLKFIFTGNKNSLYPKLLKRDIQTNSNTITSVHRRLNDGIFINVAGRLLVYYKHLIYTSGENVQYLNITNSDVTPLENHVLVVNLRGSPTQTVSMLIKESNGYWYISDMMYNMNELYMNNPATRIGTPIGFSYACSTPLVYHLTSTIEPVLTFIGLQIEPDFHENPRLTKFSDSWNCTGFMSSGILSGLAVTLMLLIILGIGISCMMNIKTFNKFDDPKSKTIQVAVTE